MNYAKLAGLLAIVLLSCYGTWYATSDHYQKIIAENQVASDKTVQTELEANLQLKAAQAAKDKAAEENRAKNESVIHNLAGQLARVHVHIPSCGQVSGAVQAGTGTDGGTGVLPESVDGLFAGLQGRVDALVLRCDTLNNDAIRLNNQVK